MTNGTTTGEGTVTSERDYSKLTGHELRDRLIRQPQLADRCDLEKLDDSDWCDLLEKRPELADKCDQWNAFEGEQFARLLSVSVAFSERRTA